MSPSWGSPSPPLPVSRQAPSGPPAPTMPTATRFGPRISCRSKPVPPPKTPLDVIVVVVVVVHVLAAVLLSSATLRPKAAAAASSAAKSHRRGTEAPKTLGICLRRNTHKRWPHQQKHALPPSEPRVLVVVVWSASSPPLRRRRRARPRAPPRVRVSCCTVPGAPCVPHPGRGTTKRTGKERDPPVSALVGAGWGDTQHTADQNSTGIDWVLVSRLYKID
ncbi:hypothetical protein B0T18DRAFT_103276 [Schizothecium vesticola]|uniref:Uncharacterized protein n=1 Tax=Schizothecium vesticola TaxID=314040 RepID=A0AA40F1U2_9PEZI|nr:hypothetical protein B0T18DRAFT_103276 [Schizothecium vesticola]